MGAYKRNLLPSEPDANRATFSFGDIPCIGFVSHKNKSIDFMTMTEFELLMDFYMRDYLPNQRKH